MMRPGQSYPAYNLAIRFNLKARDLSPLLLAMVDAGQLVRAASSNGSVRNFSLPDTAPAAAEPVEKYVGIPAAPRTYVVMTGDLNSYAAEIRRHADLCMAVRR
ncbi:hypothetical protein ABWH74_006002 [Burkholderia vietnamiensis]